MRKRIYEIVHVYDGGLWSNEYKYFMILTIALGLLPLAVKGPSSALFRVVRICRYSKSIRIILEILKKSRKPLAAVGGLAVGYILASTLIVFDVEPDSFKTSLMQYIGPQYL